MRPRHSLTEMVQTKPVKARVLVFDALEAASYDYAVAGATLGLSRRQIYVLCHDLGITNAVTCLRRQSGNDHRGRPRKVPPSKAALRRVLEAANGSMASAARALGVSPPTLKMWLEIAA